jgi:hypothetical protein
MNEQPTHDSTATGPGGSSQRDGGNIVDLISRLTQQGAHLAQEQVSLVQAEMREGVNDIKEAVTALLGAAVVGIAALGVLLMGAGYLLGDAIDNIGLGILIVGIVAAIIAAIMFASARKKVSAANLKPERTIRTAGDTPEAVTGHMSNTGGTHAR